MVNRLILYGITVVAAFVLTAGVSGAVDNDTKTAAGKKYLTAKKAFNKADLAQKLRLEEDFIAVLSIIPNDIKDMCYDTVRYEAVSGGGSYPRFKNVRHTNCVDYFPNRMIAKIRALAPPKPLLAAWQDKSGKKVVCQLTNIGKTRLERIKLILSADGVPDQTKTKTSLMPGESYTETFNVRPFLRRIRLRMEEKYHFTALPVGIY